MSWWTRGSSVHPALSDPVRATKVELLRVIGKHISQSEDVRQQRDEFRLRNGIDHCLEAMMIHIQAGGRGALATRNHSPETYFLPR